MRAINRAIQTYRNYSFSVLRPFEIILADYKVSVKENAHREKNSSRASIFATKASYISN